MTFRRRSVIASLAAAATIGSRPVRARVLVADHAGRNIEIRDASRVISIGGAVTETVYAVGAGDRLIGVDTTSLYPESARRLPQVGYMRQISAEGVLSLRPTLVISTLAAGPPVAFDQLRGAGVSTLVLPEDYAFATVLNKIESIGHALGRDDAATALIESREKEMAALNARLARATTRPKVLSLLAIGQGAPQAAGRKTAADGIIRLAGGINAVTTYDSYRPVTVEGAMALAPDVVMVASHTFDALGGIDGVLRSSSLELTPAGRDRRVFALDSLLLLGFGPRTPEAAYRLAAFLHPELNLGDPK